MKKFEIMHDSVASHLPASYRQIEAATKKLQFNMASDLYTGSLLKTLVASKPGGNILELGTGSGLATSWMVEGMDETASLTTVENNELLLNIARQALQDKRINFVLADAYNWINTCNGKTFDLVFADAMPGKYDLFDETFALVKTGGFYIIDDMLPQPNWPDGHIQKVEKLLADLEARTDAVLTKMHWSTGIVIVTKVKEH